MRTLFNFAGGFSLLLHDAYEKNKIKGEMSMEALKKVTNFFSKNMALIVIAVAAVALFSPPRR